MRNIQGFVNKGNWLHLFMCSNLAGLEESKMVSQLGTLKKESFLSIRLH